MLLPPISVEGDTLHQFAEPFEVRGINYIYPSDTPPGCPELHFGAHGGCPWSQDVIDADMAFLRAHGVNTVRIFLNFYVFGGARVSNPEADMVTPVTHLEALLASANRHGIYVIPVLLAKYPQPAMTAADVEQAATLHVVPLVRRFQGHSGILAWDLFNEPDIGSPIDERCWDWDNGDFPLCEELARQRTAFLVGIHAALRQHDPTARTTVGMAFAKSYAEPEAIPMPLAGLVDIYSFHYYDNDPHASGRYAAHWYYGAGLPGDLRRAIDELHGLNLNKPVLITELGFPSGSEALRDEEGVQRDLQLSLAVAREHRAAGVLLWPFQPAPTLLTGGLFD